MVAESGSDGDGPKWSVVVFWSRWRVVSWRGWTQGISCHGRARRSGAGRGGGEARHLQLRLVVTMHAAWWLDMGVTEMN